MENIIEWTGFRPLTPNDMPLIGRDEKYKNLIYGMGLGWLGMTFGPALATILKDLIINNLENGRIKSLNDYEKDKVETTKMKKCLSYNLNKYPYHFQFNKFIFLKYNRTILGIKRFRFQTY